jgi:hypothetical protein
MSNSLIIGLPGFFGAGYTETGKLLAEREKFGQVNS